MPSSRADLPSTIKVVGRGSKSVSDPLFDTRSKKSNRSRGRSRSKVSVRRSKSRDRSSYEPPRSSLEDTVSDAVRNIDLDDTRQDEDYHRRRRSSSRDRRSRRQGYTSDRSGRRDRGRVHSERRRRSERSRSRGRHDDYRQFEEDDDGDYDYHYSKMNNQADAAAELGSDPFNFCQGDETFSDVEPPSRTQKTRRQLGVEPTLSQDSHNIEGPTWSEEPYYQTRQDHSYASIAVSALQLLVLMLQLAMCGIAPMDVNPMVGPFPDAFSEWGGKNAYLMLEENQYWRFITPAFLHVGVLHLLANTFCLLYSSALFEREWGSWTWLFIFLISEAGCIGVSSIADPNTIAVGSSGALMGLFAAKLAHVLTYTFFETNDMSADEGIHVDQLSSVLCGLTLVSLLSSFTYVDWSGHMGGLASGFFGGIVFFARPIRSCCYSFLWTIFGLAGLGGTGFLIGYFLMTEAEPDEELADACEYFRNLFPEGYECGCLW